MKIAIFWNYLFHYRVSFYERLARMPGVQLTVFHGGEDPIRRGNGQFADAKWSFQSVRITTLGKPVFGAEVFFQWGMWRHLLRRRYDVIVCEGNFGILSNVLAAEAKMARERRAATSPPPP